MDSFKTIKTVELAAVSGGTYRSGASQVIAGQQEMDRALGDATLKANQAGLAAAKATRGHDANVGNAIGATIGGAVGRGLGWTVGAVRGLGTGLAANFRTFNREISQ